MSTCVSCNNTLTPKEERYCNIIGYHVGFDECIACREKRLGKVHPEKHSAIYQELTAIHVPASQVFKALQEVGENHPELLNDMRMWRLVEFSQVFNDTLKSLMKMYEEKKA